MNDWKANATVLLWGARIGPVGMSSGIMVKPRSTFGTKPAGNSVAFRFAEPATLPLFENVTK